MVHTINQKPPVACEGCGRGFHTKDKPGIMALVDMYDPKRKLRLFLCWECERCYPASVRTKAAGYQWDAIKALWISIPNPSKNGKHRKKIRLRGSYYTGIIN